MIDVTVPWEVAADVDLNLHNLLFYALTITILIENLYQLAKPFLKKKLKTHDLESGEIVEKPMDWKHAYMPPAIGIILALTFYPVTYFSFMPFAPVWKFLEVAYTAILFGRIANAGHSAADRITELSLSLIGRIIGIKKW